MKWLGSLTLAWRRIELTLRPRCRGKWWTEKCSGEIEVPSCRTAGRSGRAGGGHAVVSRKVGARCRRVSRSCPPMRFASVRATRVLPRNCPRHPPRSDSSLSLRHLLCGGRCCRCRARDQAAGARPGDMALRRLTPKAQGASGEREESFDRRARYREHGAHRRPAAIAARLCSPSWQPSQAASWRASPP